uniref:Uncharacterized protein LOC104228286 n=1 Tax=Nicotiana sylvestris TaxID=4096 RepID=A0A1U7WKE8_NICSY|nr:PREDICTED: uncharacterized protein LOC104228286 [Nicotiana sylvestris]
MEGMTSLTNQNTQTDKELFEIKEAIGFIKQKGKETEQVGIESPFDGDCSMGQSRLNRPREFQAGSTPTGNFFTRFSRLDFSRFSGYDLRSWLYKVDQVFSMEEISFDERVKVASIHFDGEAIAWHRSYMRSRNTSVFPTWMNTY